MPENFKSIRFNVLFVNAALTRDVVRKVAFIKLLNHLFLKWSKLGMMVREGVVDFVP